jgi:hypothetical protein
MACWDCWCPQVSCELCCGRVCLNFIWGSHVRCLQAEGVVQWCWDCWCPQVNECCGAFCCTLHLFQRTAASHAGHQAYPKAGQRYEAVPNTATNNMYCSCASLHLQMEL